MAGVTVLMCFSGGSILLECGMLKNIDACLIE